MSSCGHNELERISNQLDIDITNGKISETSDSHSGFHGDGLLFTAVTFTDDTVLNDISANSQWTELPLDQTTEILVYGINDKDTSAGPYITQNNEILFPPIESGFYYLIDKQEDQTTNILDRPSFNITIAIFDKNANTLYYCEFDT